MIVSCSCKFESFVGQAVPRRHADQDSGGGDGPLQLGPARPLLPDQDGRQVRGQVRQLRVRGDEAAGGLGPAPPVPGLGRRQAGQAQGHPREHIEQESQSGLHRRVEYLLTYY